MLICVKGCSNDKTGKRFEPGDKVPDNAFSQKVVKGWLKQGVLKEEKNG